MSDTAHTLEVGTMVSTPLYDRGRGYITAIHGEQMPQTVKRIGGLMGTGGNAHFDIIFEIGARSVRLPECIIHGPQWKIYPKEAGFAEAWRLAELEKLASDLEAAQLAKEREEEAAFARVVEALKADPAYADLEQGDDCDGALAAKNIRKLLKAAFKTTKFSVRKSEYGCIYVRWCGGPSEDQVSEITGRFKTGTFDHHSDCARQEDTPWSKSFGGAEYVFTSRSEA
ncbi:LPD29 domain-containing protein [Asaia sp. VD9]|uniref:LPD29 domain-containing protein n=1 Tax=Asaia sp. VD9 TaxID=3081235 RepID=UPI003016847B